MPLNSCSAHPARFDLTVEAYRALETLLADGKVRAIGVSNFMREHLDPTERPSRDQVFGQIAFDYKFVLNVIAAVIFATLFALTMRRGVTDPVCHMKVDRDKALASDYHHHTYYFCSTGCQQHFQADPEHYAAV